MKVKNTLPKQLIPAILLSAFLASHLIPSPVKVIYDTDMETDRDDAAALGMLHAMQDNGECEILAVVHNTSDHYGPGCIDAINTYYGRPDIPIGAYKANDANSRELLDPHFRLIAPFAQMIAQDPAFPNDIVTRDDVPDAVQVYKDALRDQPDNSVVIISVGFVTNLHNLLKDPEGLILVQEKVGSLVIMGGIWTPVETDDTLTMNLAGQQYVPIAAEAADYVFANWPTKMELLGREIGKPLKSGNRLKDTSLHNPVREAYRIINDERNRANWNSASFDQATVLYAVRGTGPDDQYWDIETIGSPDIFQKSDSLWYCRWNTTPDSLHTFIKEKMSPDALEDIIEELMVQAPALSTQPQTP